ncbi:unnamed protein product [Paramecium octaurelia]|uniref:Uncharacterized protein n=1 Tax=Paramecium octaurelia TaxID=43137 RepID=A0A8S1WIB7_PAROT|nr:unnamed protein product [Paramecium octaurelia]CAD8188340.1 unnamed protein product [Paramecium octaurelia]
MFFLLQLIALPRNWLMLIMQQIHPCQLFSALLQYKLQLGGSIATFLLFFIRRLHPDVQLIFIKKMEMSNLQSQNIQIIVIWLIRMYFWISFDFQGNILDEFISKSIDYSIIPEIAKLNNIRIPSLQKLCSHLNQKEDYEIQSNSKLKNPKSIVNYNH